MEITSRECGRTPQEEVCGNSTKGELEVKSKEMVHSPQEKKKSRKVKERKEKVAERLKKMTTRERCLIMEMEIYAKEELQEVPVEYQDMCDYMEEISAGKKNALLAKKAGNSSRGGGGWP